ncbi:MAG: cold shock domain-containing protein [Acidobacteriota bacterium]
MPAAHDITRPSRRAGRVKWYSLAKGYGFIAPEPADAPPRGGDASDGSAADDEIFVHHSALAAAGLDQLFDGERVRYRVVDAPRGLRAVDLVRLDPAPAF